MMKNRKYVHNVPLGSIDTMLAVRNYVNNRKDVGASQGNPLIKVSLDPVEGDGSIETVEFHAADVLKHHGIKGGWGKLAPEWDEQSLAEDYALFISKRQFGDQREYRVEVIDDGLSMQTNMATDALIQDGVTDYCGQVCGGGNCGSGDVCMYGIESKTHMPPTWMSVQQWNEIQQKCV